MAEHPPELAAAEDADDAGGASGDEACHRPECRRLPCADGRCRARRRHRADGRRQDDDRARARRDASVGRGAIPTSTSRRRPARPSASCATAKASTRCTRARRPSSSTRWRLAGPNVISAAASVDRRPRRPRRDARRRASPSSGSTPARTSWPTRFDSADEHRPAYGPIIRRRSSPRRQPIASRCSASVGAHRIDVDGLTPDEVVARVARTCSASIGA